MMQRTRRMEPELLTASDFAHDDAHFRLDLERIRFSPYFARLSAVTQVISQAGSGPLVHNRLTHSLKVTAVARVIANNVSELTRSRRDSHIEHIEYECNPVVAQAAASAHDLGHPPFGHLGESVLNRLARQSLGLLDGFEGNAQTYRIIASLDVCHGASRGLNLTAAVRAAVAKYPWVAVNDASKLDADRLPRGMRASGDGVVAQKYSAYFLDAADLMDARDSSPGLRPFEQSLECSVMDIADDIAYSIHDVDDFYRAGVLSQGAVAREFRAWTDNEVTLRSLEDRELDSRTPLAGSALERLRRKLRRNDPWIADDEAFSEAVRSVAEDLVDGLLAESFDGSIAAERSLSSFTSRWIHHLQSSVILAPADNPRTGLVTLNQRAWHEVEVLKFVHKHFVLNRADIAMYQRGLSRVLVRAVKGLIAWLDDEHDQYRVPPRLKELVEIATEGYANLARDQANGVVRIADSDVSRLGTGRGVLDYVASLSDGQAMAVSEAIDGRPDRLWDIGQNP